LWSWSSHQFALLPQELDLLLTQLVLLLTQLPLLFILLVKQFLQPWAPILLRGDFSFKILDFLLDLRNLLHNSINLALRAVDLQLHRRGVGSHRQCVSLKCLRCAEDKKDN
jgi:hypothetical protein